MYNINSPQEIEDWSESRKIDSKPYEINHYEKL